MKSVLKKTAIGLLVLLLLVIVTAVTLPFIIDPNDYKDKISGVVKQHTGRELSIPGNLGWSFFPWLGIEAGEIQLGNAPGFKPDTFATVKQVDVRIKVLPLLKGHLEVGQVVLEGLDVTLQRNAQGITNWADLMQPAAPESGAEADKPQPDQPSSGQPPMITALAIAGLEVRQARLVWDDQLTRQYYSLEPLNLSLGKMALNTPVPIAADFHLNSRNPQAEANVKLALQFTANLEQQLFTLAKLQLQTDINSSLIPGNHAEARLNSQQILLNLANQTATTDQLAVQSFGVNLHTNLQATQILDAPRYRGSLAIDDFSPKQILQQLQIKLPEMADPRALQTLQITSDLEGDMQRIALNNLFVQFDESELSGELNVSQFNQPAIGYNLTLNQIDVDRYLPARKSTAAKPNKKTSTRAVATPATAAAEQATLIPVELVRQLRLDGTLRIARLKAMNLDSREIRITTRAKNGRVRLHPLGAQLYQGNYSGDIELDATGKTPRISLNENLSDVQLGPLLKDLWGDDKVRGQANLSAELKASGNRPLAIRKTLTGSSRFRIKDAEVKDIDMAQLQKVVNDIDDDTKAVLSAKNLLEATVRVDQIKQKFAGIKNPQANNATYLSEITGTVQIKNGLARNRDLRARLPYGRVRGEGSVDLVRLYSDYTAYIKLTSKGAVKSGQSYEQMDKTPLKIYFKGPLESLTPQPDFGDYLSTESKKALEQAEQKYKQELQQKVDKKLEEKKDKLEQKLEEKADDLLKKLFK